MRFFAAVAACLAVSACTSDPGPGRFEQTAGGEIMTTAQGLSLYTYQRDQDFPGHSTCVGACAVMFPPYLVSPRSLARARENGIFGPFADRTAPPGAEDYPLPRNTTWSTVRRPDGSLQWAHSGTPLYTYHRDILPGDRLGDGLYGVWKLADPAIYGE